MLSHLIAISFTLLLCAFSIGAIWLNYLHHRDGRPGREHLQSRLSQQVPLPRPVEMRRAHEQVAGQL